MRHIVIQCCLVLRLGIKRIFFRTMNDSATVRYQYKIEFGNFFNLRFLILSLGLTSILLGKSRKITLIWPLFLLIWQILRSRHRSRYSSAIYCCCCEFTGLCVFLLARLVAVFQSIQASLAWARRTYTKEHISIVAARGRVYHVFMNRWVAEWLFGQENTHPSDCNFKLSSQTRRPVALCGNELLFAKKWKKNDPSRRVHQKIQEICLKILKCDLKPS